MAKVRLLANVANDVKGAVIDVDDERAVKLVRTGYAERIPAGRTSAGKAEKEE